MHTWYLSQAIPPRMGRGNYLASHTRIQIKNFYCLQESVPSLSWGGLPDSKHLFSADSWLFISHFSVTGSSDFCYPGRSSFRQAQHASCKAQSHSKKQHPLARPIATDKCHPLTPAPELCGKTGASLQPLAQTQNKIPQGELSVLSLSAPRAG